MTLRLRPDVHNALRRSAFENYRSLTAEINELLAAVLLNKKETAEGQLGGPTSTVSEAR